MDEDELKKNKTRNEKIKKKKIIIFLAIILVIMIIGLIINNKNSNGNKRIISQDELSQYITEKIQISIENWKDYIITEDTIVENKNDFGELTSIYKSTKLKLKNDICGYVILNVKAKNKQEWFGDTEEILTICGGRGSLNDLLIYNKERNEKSNTENEVEINDRTFTIDDIECTQLTGYLYKINIPDSIWETDKNGKQYFNLQSDDSGWWECLKENNKENNYINIISNMEYQKYKKQINK